MIGFTIVSRVSRVSRVGRVRVKIAISVRIGLGLCLVSAVRIFRRPVSSVILTVL